MIPRTVFAAEHELFRKTVAGFVADEIAPHHAQWEKDGVVPREAWRKAGEAGLLCVGAPEEYGGAGADFRYSAVIVEELARAGASGPGFALHSDIVMPYILDFGSAAVKRKYLPPMVSGETIAAIAMTEPDTGSDLQRIRATAVRDGDHYVVNGAKTFITNAMLCDIVVLAVKTDPDKGAHGMSMLVVEADTPGFVKGRNFDKIGNKAQDTGELFFDDVRVPVGNMLGEENGGWNVLMNELVQERLIVAVTALTTCEVSLEQTLAYTRDRHAFGQPLFDFQNTRFKLAEMTAQVQVGRVFVDHCLALHVKGELDMVDAAKAKLWTTELQDRVLDQCLQLFGGNGYMREYPIARAWADARVHRIYAGTSEIMKEIIARSL